MERSTGQLHRIKSDSAGRWCEYDYRLELQRSSLTATLSQMWCMEAVRQTHKHAARTFILLLLCKLHVCTHHNTKVVTA